MTSHLFQHLLAYAEGGPTPEPDPALQKDFAAAASARSRFADTANMQLGDKDYVSPADKLEAEYGQQIPYNRLIPRNAASIARVDDTIEPRDKNDKPIPWTKRPGLLPVTKDYDGTLRFAAPALPEILQPAGEVPGGALTSGIKLPTPLAAGRIPPKVNELGLYSKALNEAENLTRGKGTAKDFHDELLSKKVGVKPDELEHTGFTDWVNENPNRKVTKDEVVSYLKDNQVKIGEKVQGQPGAEWQKEMDKLNDRYEDLTRLQEQSGDRYVTLGHQYGWNHPDTMAANELHSRVSQQLLDLGHKMDAHTDLKIDMHPPQYGEYTLKGLPDPKSGRIPEMPQGYTERITTLEPKTRYKPGDVDIKAIEDEAFNNFKEYAEKHPQWYSKEEIDQARKDPRITANWHEALVKRGLSNQDIRKLERGENIPDRPIYTSSHFEAPNPIAHIRTSDRTGPNGEKILHIEEMQSDWAQEGRKYGFKEKEEGPPLTHGEMQAKFKQESDAFANNPDHTGFHDFIKREAGGDWDHLSEMDRGHVIRSYLQARGESMAPHQPMLDLHEQLVYGTHDDMTPRGPFVDTTGKWTELQMKRILHEAEKGGYDAVTWSPGTIHAQRYGMENHFEAIHYDPDTMTLTVQNRPTPNNPWAGGNEHQNVTPAKLKDFVGEDLAQRLLATDRADVGYHTQVHTLSGEGLVSGGEGHKAFYDNMIPNEWRKTLKKHDPEAKLEMLKIRKGAVGTRSDFKDLDTGVKLTPDQMASKTMDMDVPGFRMTKPMRNSIQKGQPLFVRAPLPPLHTLTQQEQNDHR